MHLSFEMHLESTIVVSSALQSSTDFTNSHLAVRFVICILLLLKRLLFLLSLHFRFKQARSIVDSTLKNSFEFFLLQPMLLNLSHDSLWFLNITFFSLLLSICDEKLNFLFKLFDTIVKLGLLKLRHLWGLRLLRCILTIIQSSGRIFKKLTLQNTCLFNLLSFSTIIALNRIFSSNQTLLDFVINVIHFHSEVVNELLLVLSLIGLFIGII